MFLVICPVQVVVSVVVVNETDLIFIEDGVTGVTPLVSIWPRTTTMFAPFVNWTLQFCVVGVLLVATVTYLGGPLSPLQQTDAVEERHLLSLCSLHKCQWCFRGVSTVYHSTGTLGWAATSVLRSG
jgi:hypothetical protein